MVKEYGHKILTIGKQSDYVEVKDFFQSSLDTSCQKLC